MKTIENHKSWKEHINTKYGKEGTESREKFEQEFETFRIGALIQEARKKQHLTQQQLAEKVGTKKSYISRLENGNCDIQLSTLYRIFEDGLGRRISLIIA